jgi:hypothetical protein
VNDKIISIKNQNVILDSDVATLYGVETRIVNQAVKNNPDKFPEGYIIEFSKREWHNLRASIMASSGKSDISEYPIKIFDRMSINDKKSDSLSKEALKSTVVPKAFTEKGLYMLATILKSPRATQTTITIVETFAKLRELSSNLIALSSAEPETIEPEVLHSTGGLLKDILFSAFPQSSAETSLEVNLGLLKLKREVKNENPNVLPNIQVRLDELERLMLEIKNG